MTGDALRRALGFDVDESLWLQRVRESETVASVGRIGKFELLDEIGRGGQGIVYRARQPGTGREIAVKRLSAGVFATPNMRARFEREIEASVVLDHPNIVTVFGTEEADGQTVLAMRYVDGKPIDRWARPAGKSRREVTEILRVFLVVCDAVQHAHQRGVIHRDLKPSNILVDGEDRPFVLDFGLAKLRSETQPSATITMTGDFLGTPAFAAPEQVSLDTRAVDVRTDVYSLGAVLYHLLTGALPIGDHSDVASFLRAITQEEARAPSSIDRTLDREIDVILLKTLSKDKEQRYASVGAFADDLRRHVAGEAVLAHPPSAGYRLRKFVRAHRAAVFTSAAIVTLLVAATAVSTTLYLRAERERSRADAALVEQTRQTEEAKRQESRATTESKKAGETNGFITRMLARANRGAEKGNPNVTVREALDAAASELETTQTNYEPEVEGAIRLTIGETYDGLGLYEIAEPHYRRSFELLQEAFGEEHLRVASAMHKLGGFYRRQDRLPDAQMMLEGALRVRQREIADVNDPAIAEARVSLATLKRQMGKFDEAETLYLQAIDGYRASLGPGDVNIGTNLKNLGVLNMYWDRWEKAEPYLRDAQAFFERIPGDHEADLIDVKENLAHVLLKREDPAGVKMFREVLAEKIRVHGPAHPAVGTTSLALGHHLFIKGETEEAVALLGEAVRHIEPARLKSAIAAYIGYVFQNLGRGEQAEAFLREAMAERETFLGSAHPLIGYFQYTLAWICIDQQRFVEAEELLLPSWEKLKDWTTLAENNKKSVLDRIIGLYERWDAAEPNLGYDAKAAEWRVRRNEFE